MWLIFVLFTTCEKQLINLQSQSMLRYVDNFQYDKLHDFHVSFNFLNKSFADQLRYCHLKIVFIFCWSPSTTPHNRFLTKNGEEGGRWNEMSSQKYSTWANKLPVSLKALNNTQFCVSISEFVQKCYESIYNAFFKYMYF